MEYLTSYKHRYAAKLLAENLVGNVESALLQAEKDIPFKMIYHHFEQYYLLHDEKWQYPYIVKKISRKGVVDYPRDENIKRYKW
jgi:hypothetical protein